MRGKKSKKKKVSPKKGKLDEFLSAPDSVKQSAVELRKARERKAADSAREARENASKSTRQPTIEDILADMVRVAEDKEVNPFWADRTLSRKRYKRFGHFPVEHVDREFGTFAHAKEVAGLADKAGTRTMKAARAAQSKREHAQRYAEEVLHPHVYDPSGLDGVLTIVSISDTHATFLCQFTWYVFLRTIQHLEPDIVLCNGDILEGAEISRHQKIPGWSVPLQMEFDFAREMFRQIREVAPHTDIVWNAGNHGIDRLSAYLSSVAPALSGLRSLRFDKLAGLDDLGIQLAQGGTIASPAGTEDSLPGIMLPGGYLATHGTCLGATPSLAELRKHMCSGQSGHVHRAGLSHLTTENTGTISWMSTPMGCTDTAGRAYMKGRVTGWQRGIGVAFVHPGGRVHQYPVVTCEGVAVVEGLLVENPGLPEPDPSTLWLPEFKSQ